MAKDFYIRILFVWFILLPLFASVACDATREEGYVHIHLQNLDRQLGKTIEISINNTQSSYIRKSSIADLQSDWVLFTQVKTDDYTVSVTTLDDTGVPIQRGMSELFRLTSDALAEIPVPVISLEDTACVREQKKCEYGPGWSMVMTCTSAQQFEPLTNCGSFQRCSAEASAVICVAGTPDAEIMDCSQNTDDEVLISSCMPGTVSFSPEITHAYFPLPKGEFRRFEGYDGSDFLSITHEVLSGTETVFDVGTRALKETEYVDGELVQESLRYFAQSNSGTVCLFGETVTVYDDASPSLTESYSWRAGENGLIPGVFLPAVPIVGLSFQIEAVPGVAMDRGKIIHTGQTVHVPHGTYNDTIAVMESSPLDEGTSLKIYAAGLGLVADQDILLLP